MIVPLTKVKCQTQSSWSDARVVTSPCLNSFTQVSNRAQIGMEEVISYQKVAPAASENFACKWASYNSLDSFAEVD